ncbi:hypothetical protein [Acidovorax sp. ACV01]|uniref:hypothetical protein n=1 Tax=Acidovorax sp. ACV01 TaxID=2769311 RepID=UPI00177BD33C|nr:hypothetical protein [Acidovorax sp. ACV01]MBD9395293.1 hypothetical protein [Acidovorax sp. ACV01]
MKTKLSLCALACFLAACSNGPSGSELASSMTSELQKKCEYASVDNAQVTNTFFPNSDNKNLAKVKFTATIKVKIDGKMAEDLKTYQTASALYAEYGKEMAELNRSYKEQMDALSKVRQSTLDKYLAQEDERGYLTGDHQKHSEEMRDFQSQKEALGKASAAQANEIFEKYKDRAGDLLYATSSGNVRMFAEPTKPEVPFGCLGYRDPRTPLGILYKSVLDEKRSVDDYFSGVETFIEGERQMIKTDNGWMVAGNL